MVLGLKLKKRQVELWSKKEQLCLASAVIRSGHQNWMTVSRAMKGIGEPSRAGDCFSQKNCAVQYSLLLENEETPKRKGRKGEMQSEIPSEAIKRKLAEGDCHLINRRMELLEDLQQRNLMFQKVKDDVVSIMTGTGDDSMEDMMENINDETKLVEMEMEQFIKWLKEKSEGKKVDKIQIDRHSWVVPANLSLKKLKAEIIRRNSSQSEVSSENDSTLDSPLSVDVVGDDNADISNTSISDCKKHLSPTPTSPLLTSLLKSSSLVPTSQGTSLLHTAITSPQRVSPLIISSGFNIAVKVAPPSTVSTNLKNLVTTAISGGAARSEQAHTSSLANSPSAGAPTLSMLLDRPLSLPGKPLPEIPSTDQLQNYISKQSNEVLVSGIGTDLKKVDSSVEEKISDDIEIVEIDSRDIKAETMEVLIEEVVENEEMDLNSEEGLQTIEVTEVTETLTALQDGDIIKEDTPIIIGKIEDLPEKFRETVESNSPPEIVNINNDLFKTNGNHDESKNQDSTVVEELSHDESSVVIYDEITKCCSSLTEKVITSHTHENIVTSPVAEIIEIMDEEQEVDKKDEIVTDIEQMEVVIVDKSAGDIQEIQVVSDENIDNLLDETTETVVAQYGSQIEINSKSDFDSEESKSIPNVSPQENVKGDFVYETVTIDTSNRNNEETLPGVNEQPDVPLPTSEDPNIFHEKTLNNISHSSSGIKKPDFEPVEEPVCKDDENPVIPSEKTMDNGTLTVFNSDNNITTKFIAGEAPINSEEVIVNGIVNIEDVKEFSQIEDAKEMHIEKSEVTILEENEKNHSQGDLLFHKIDDSDTEVIVISDSDSRNCSLDVMEIEVDLTQIQEIREIVEEPSLSWSVKALLDELIEKVDKDVGSYFNTKLIEEPENLIDRKSKVASKEGRTKLELKSKKKSTDKKRKGTKYRHFNALNPSKKLRMESDIYERKSDEINIQDQSEKYCNNQVSIEIKSKQNIFDNPKSSTKADLQLNIESVKEDIKEVESDKSLSIVQVSKSEKAKQFLEAPITKTNNVMSANLSSVLTEDTTAEKHHTSSVDSKETDISLTNNEKIDEDEESITFCSSKTVIIEDPKTIANDPEPLASIASKLSSSDFESSSPSSLPSDTEAAKIYCGKKKSTMGSISSSPASLQGDAESVKIGSNGQKKLSIDSIPSSPTPSFIVDGEGAKTSKGKKASAIDSVPNSPAMVDDEREYKTWKKAIMLVYSRIAAHKYASLFLRPITDEQAPGYSCVIHRPIDLSVIKKNIESGLIRTTAEFQRDVLIMFQNSIMYNKSNHFVSEMARQMQQEAIQHIQDFLTTQMLVQVAGDVTLRRETRTMEKHRDTVSSSNTDDDNCGVKRRRHDEKSTQILNRRKKSEDLMH